jgi:hypothetical protein
MKLLSFTKPIAALVLNATLLYLLALSVDYAFAREMHGFGNHTCNIDRFCLYIGLTGPGQGVVFIAALISVVVAFIFSLFFPWVIIFPKLMEEKEKESKAGSVAPTPVS